MANVAVNLHLIHLGDLPGWLGAIGNVAAVSLALWQVGKERRAREADKREAATAERRRQAQRLSAWYAGDTAGPNAETLMLIANRSDEPVHEAVAWLIIVQGAGPKNGEDYAQLRGDSSRFDDYRVFLNIPPGKWIVTFPTSWRGMHRQPGVEVAFTDSNGVHWIRRASGKLEEIPKPPLEHYAIGRPPSYLLLSPAGGDNTPNG